MKVKVKNLGALKQAEFTVGDLTIICGGNNTGKTYATYALYGFLSAWRQVLSIDIDFDLLDRLLNDGVVRIDLKEYVARAEKIIAEACKVYTQQLPKIFAAQADRFQKTEFQVSIDSQNIHLESELDVKTRSANVELLATTKSKESTLLVVTLLVEEEQFRLPRDILKQVISETIKNLIFNQIFPRPFIASAERTGAAIFRKELNFARNRLLEEMGQADKNINPIELLFKVYQDYALPVEKNVDFTRQLETIVKKSSFLAENHLDVLADFADIIGGEYTVTRNDELYYVPKGKRVKLSMDESSSAVRSLLDIGFYLRHEAKLGDLLIIDEPELNLHPENQRRVARLFARLVNLGIKIFITTHSDYIIKEINTLIALNHDKPHLKRIAREEGYRQEELISSDLVKVYIAKEELILLEGRKRKTKCHTLIPAQIDPELGIEASSFDTTIETMNRIQEAIVWGEE